MMSQMGGMAGFGGRRRSATKSPKNVRKDRKNKGRTNYANRGGGTPRLPQGFGQGGFPGGMPGGFPGGMPQLPPGSDFDLSRLNLPDK